MAEEEPSQREKNKILVRFIAMLVGSVLFLGAVCFLVVFVLFAMGRIKVP